MDKADIPTREKERTSHGSQYFVIGNNKIIIKEHFTDDGKTLKTILEKVILDAGKQPETCIIP